MIITAIAEQTKVFVEVADHDIMQYVEVYARGDDVKFPSYED